jgi:hypothetical protein
MSLKLLQIAAQLEQWCSTRINSAAFALPSLCKLPKIINNKSKPILFADDTTIRMTKPNPTD